METGGLQKFGQHGAPMNMIVGTNAVDRQHSHLRVHVGGGANCMPNAISACPGRQSELEWGACCFHC